MLVTSENFAEAMQFIENVPDIALDTETTGLRVHDRDRLCGISIGHEKNTFYLPFRHGSGENLPIDWLPRVIDVISAKERWYGWNAKFDIHVLNQDGYRTPTPHLYNELATVEDVMQAAHLCNENEHSYGLKQLADKYLGPESSRDEDELRVHVESRFGKQKNSEWKGLMWRLEPELVTAYAESDVDLTWQMREFYIPAMESWDLLGSLGDEESEFIGMNLYDQMNKAMLLFARMERRGILVDPDILDTMMANCADEMDVLVHEIKKLTNGAITNPGSTPQTHAWFNRSSTAKAVLEREFKDDPVATRLLRYKALEKALGSYFVKYHASLSGDGRIRPNYNLIGTYTGRLSCSNPNLQAVPRYDEDTEASIIRRVKDVFAATEGYQLGEFDLSQAELRVASHYGGIAMYHAIKKGGPRANRYKRMLRLDTGYLPDGTPFVKPMSPMGQILLDDTKNLHQETADRIGTDYTTAKRINFSAVFGIGAEKYSKTYGIPMAESRRDLSSWHAQFPEFRELLYTMEHQAEVNGTIRLDSGRWRRYQGMKADPHAASSNLVQGTVAEVMRWGQLKVDHHLRDEGVELLLQIHDSVIQEIPDDASPDVVARTKHYLTDLPFNVPLKSDAKIGKTWGNLKKVV